MKLLMSLLVATLSFGVFFGGTLYALPLLTAVDEVSPVAISNSVQNSAQVASAQGEDPLPAPTPVEREASIEKEETYTWVSQVEEAPWEARDSASSFVFKDMLWIMGGLNGNGVKTGDDHAVHYWEARYFNDIWSSKDGVRWTLRRAEAPWDPRRSMSVFVLQGKLFMIGGWSPTSGYVDEIWSSEDGVSWEKVRSDAPYPPREGQTVEVMDGRAFLIGGVNYDERVVMNDVWYTDDGITWEKATTSKRWSPRWDHATVVYNGAIYLTGGMDLSKDTFRDVWKSEDGVVWELVTDVPPWESRQGHGLGVIDGTLFSIGRLNDDIGGGENDVWYTKDGESWKKLEPNPLWAGREDHGVLTLNNAIYVLGGMDAEWKWRNDVWVLKKDK